ncbi:MAG: helix-turn-helix transcriptional regulator [Muribaculaceae bacterium]|nr:helix-turn-helix transcriptional regulator [Muribaculaceae bacterium]
MKSIHDKAYLRMLELLRAKRIEKGITQEQLASALGVRQGIVSKIETHERRLDIIELRTICGIIGVSFTDFIRELDECLIIEQNLENEKSKNLEQ